MIFIRAVLLFLIAHLCIHVGGAPFSLTFNTLTAGAQLMIPLGETEPSFNITIDWGDGLGPQTFYTALLEVPVGTYGLWVSYFTVGTYTVLIDVGGVPVTRLGWNIDHPASGWSSVPDVQLVSINSFGDFGLTSLRGFLCRTSDNPTLPPALPSTVTDLSGFFYNTSTFDGSVALWDVSNVTNMERMFYGAKKFNQPLDTWNVAAVTNMSGMFNQAQLFNQALSSWNVASVTDMSYMFFGASAFVQSLAGWNVAAVTSMEGMFSSMSFNSAIGTWNTKSVTKMARMFESNPAFNQDLSLWNVTRVVDMTAMFNQATAFYQNLTSWCLPLIFSEPSQFATGSGIAYFPTFKPKWSCLPPSVQAPVNTPMIALQQVPVGAPTAVASLPASETPTGAPSSASICSSISSEGVCIIEGDLVVSGNMPTEVVIDRPTLINGSVVLPATTTLSIRSPNAVVNVTGCVSLSGALTVVANAPRQSVMGKAIPALQFAGGYCDDLHVKFESTVLTLLDSPACAQQSAVQPQYTAYSVSLLFDYSTSQCDQDPSSLSNALSTGAIVGIVIAIVAGLGIAIAAVVIVRFKYAVRPFSQRNNNDDIAVLKHQEL